MLHAPLSTIRQKNLIPIPRWLIVMFMVATVWLGFTASAWAVNSLEVEAAASINRISIIMNGIIRIAAIGAGVYIVWLGHNTMIRGIKGEFEFEGQFGKLKGSTPGLMFVLLGSLVIGWSLQTTASGKFGTKDESQSTTATINQDDRISDEKPPFLKGKTTTGANGNASPSNK